MQHAPTDPTPDAGQRAPATVVISQRLVPGREDDFRRWQDEMNRAVGSFAGFLGTEVVPPGDQEDEWIVIYRFDSKANLETWLHSPERAKTLERGAGLFKGPGSQQILIGEHSDEPVTVVVSHPVAPAHLDEFLAWQQRVEDAERGFPGFCGSQLLRPIPGVQEAWTTVFRFDTEEHLNDWLESAERKNLFKEGERFQDFELHRIASPFGSWFSPAAPGAGVAAPASWKTALSVLVGLYPTVVLLTIAISELWKGAQLWESLLLGNILSVGLLTWVVMPVVTRALGFWLEPDPRAASPRLDAIGAVVSVLFLTFAAALFWLVTTQVWKLP